LTPHAADGASPPYRAGQFRARDHRVRPPAKADEAGEEAAQNVRVPIEALYGAPERLERVAAFVVEHWEKRPAAMEGKAMLVTMSRDIAARLYEQIRKLRPQWHDEDDALGVIKVVMTGIHDDEPLVAQHARSKGQRKALADGLQGPGRQLPPGDCRRHVADRFRRAGGAHDVPRQAAGRAQPHAGDHPRGNSRVSAPAAATTSASRPTAAPSAVSRQLLTATRGYRFGDALHQHCQIPMQGGCRTITVDHSREFTIDGTITAAPVAEEVRRRRESLARLNGAGPGFSGDTG
jgi:hypothetical protein